MAGRPGRRRHFRARIPWFQRLAAPFSAGPLGPDAGGRVPSGRPPSGKPSALSRRRRKAAEGRPSKQQGRVSKPGGTKSKFFGTKSKAGGTKSKFFGTKSKSMSFRESRLYNGLSPIPAEKPFAAALPEQGPTPDPAWAPRRADGAGRRPRMADFDCIHGDHDNEDFYFPKANVGADLSVRPCRSCSRPSPSRRYGRFSPSRRPGGWAWG